MTMISNKSEYFIDLAKKTLETESQGIDLLKNRFADPLQRQSFLDAVDLLLHCHGRIVVSGIGKSGHIARKIAATFASTGSPAFFVHPAEASHGDLGMIQAQDVFLALSYSGEASELMTIVPLIKRMGAKLIAMTGKPDSALAKLADIHLNVAIEKEACPLNLAPTTSTTASLAMGDALAVVLLDARNFKADDFAKSHPGGSLGRQLLTMVGDIMHAGVDVPQNYLTDSITTLLLEMSKKRLGMTVITDTNNHVIGVFTDGDLRRLLEKTLQLEHLTVAEVINHHPQTVVQDILAAQALEIMERLRINQLVVVDAENKLVGALNMHDLLSHKIL